MVGCGRVPLLSLPVLLFALEERHMQKHQPLVDLIGNFHGIFLPRDLQYSPELSQRAAFLFDGIRRLEDAVQEEDVDDFANRLASIFARLCALVSVRERKDFVFLFAKKYGGKCAYCQAVPCICTESQRAEACMDTSSQAAVKDWSLGMWQRHLGELYGEKNARKSIHYLLLRMFSEATEVQQCWLASTIPPVSEDRERFNRAFAMMIEEIGDVLAWLIATANYLHIDLEEAVVCCYKDGCKHCKHLVCTCDKFVLLKLD